MDFPDVWFMFGLFGLFDLRPCQRDNGYLDGRSQIKVHTDERTQVHSAQSSLAVTHPGTNRARRSLTSVTESPSKLLSPLRTSSMYSRRVTFVFFQNFPHDEFEQIFAMKRKPRFDVNSTSSLPSCLASFRYSSSEQLNGDVSSLNFKIFRKLVDFSWIVELHIFL